ncbi:MAG: endonuclease MutS2 [Candidatus Kapabacteria bacterium]|jgi:DNA mismatch repair protein MutS2|nr:endonuclease MutS2 [Candidatus Kapabacteria bacterium]
MTNTEATLSWTTLEELDLGKVLSRVATYCMTEMGAEAVLAMKPVFDVQQLRTDLDRVQEAVDVSAEGEFVPFERLRDVRPLLKKSRIEGNYLSASELIAIGEVLTASRTLKRYFGERGAKSPNLLMMIAELVDDRMLEKHISDAIDESGTVRDNASRELLSIRRDIHELSARLRTRLQRMLKKFGEEELLQDEFVTQRDGRFVLPVRVENKRSVPGIIHGVSASGGTVFLEPAETFEMNNDLSILHNQELREIQRILTTLTAEVGSVSYALEASFATLIEFDTILARARYALEYGGLKPEIWDDDAIEMVRVQHPILRHAAGRNPAAVVPLSVSFDATTRGILISGPNAGGKTVAMKTIGLTLAMAQSGVFPLGVCRTSLRRVFSAIGDHQSIDSNLSTFSSQIIRLRDILSFCGSDALVLIDEICAGTDPAEGGALAAGILDSLIERKACFVVTTHQSSLKQYALSRTAIRNASLAFDESRMQPTFQFLNDVPGNSYAFVLAQNVGLPDVVLSRARSYLGNRHDELEQSIAAMQRFRTEAEEQYRIANEERAKADRLKKDFEERLHDVKVRKAKLVDEARIEAQEILRKAQALVENTIREVRESQKSPTEIKKTFALEKQALTERPAPPTRDVEMETDVVSGPLAEGMMVVVDGTSNVGTIISIDQRSQQAVVEVNGMKFRFASNVLRPASKKQIPKRDSSVFMKFDSRSSCDVRGQRADEALKEVEGFLSDAVLGNLTHATIIHGKGTGALRKVLHDYLRDHSQVRSFRNGTIEEGGEGITVVEMR